MSARIPAEHSLWVLLADDHRASRVAARRILERAGHCVTEVATGHEVVEHVARASFDLVLMDLGMPGLDGLEATRRIRALPPPAGRVPIVAVSGYVSELDRERCLAAGMNAFVGKPYRVRELLAALLPVLGAAGPPAEREAERSAGFSRAEFTASAREDLRQLGEAAGAGHREEVRRLAHGLAGAAAIWGIEDVRELARRIHASASEASLEELSALVDALRQAVVRSDGDGGGGWSAC